MSINETPERKAAREAYSRKKSIIFECDLDSCANTFGNAPCTATGEPCYNTYGTCKDQPNYALTTKTYKFTERGAPIPAGEHIRPYIVREDASDTKLELSVGLARRASRTIVLTDEACSDVGLDPYYASRSKAATGSFWTRFLARNKNYAGRWARIRDGFVVDPWDWNTFQDSLYIIESIKGPDSRGQVKVTLKDPTKLADRDKIPRPTDGALAAGIGAADTSLTLNAGEGAQYDGDEYLVIDDEVIRYTPPRVGDTFNGLSRGQFGTTAAAHDVDASVQACKSFINMAWTDVIIEILNDIGISNTYIDTAGFATEEGNWLGATYLVDTVITEPTAAKVLLEELAVEATAAEWWDPIVQKVKFKVIAGDPPQSGLTQWNDEAHLSNVEVETLDEDRLTRSMINYGLRSATEDRDKAKNYQYGKQHIDADAEDVEYKDVRPLVINSRWINNNGAAIAVTGRKVTRYRDAPKRITGRLDPKDYTEGLGDLVEVKVEKLVDETGAPKTTRCLVTKLKNKGTHIDVELETTIFGPRRGKISPNGIADYPTDDAYAHICNDTGLMTDGTDGWVIQ